VGPGQRLVFGVDGDPSRNGGVVVDFVFDPASMQLGNDDDELVLLTPAGVVVDEVRWDAGVAWPDPQGASFSLLPGLEGDNGDPTSWCVAVTPFGAGDAGTPGAANDCGTTGVDDLEDGDLVITEVMQDVTTVPDDDGEWFELTNTTAATVDLDGLEVADADGEVFTVSTAVLVAPGAAVVLAAAADPVVNGGISAAWGWGSAMSLGNGDDELILTAPDGTELDRVEWDGGTDWPDETGASMQLGTPWASVDNGDGTQWCPSTAVMPNGELGTPGDPNGPC
jgi:hypothetical protein